MGCSASVQKIGNSDYFTKENKEESVISDTSSTRSLCVHSPDTPQDPLFYTTTVPPPVPPVVDLSSMMDEIWFKPRPSFDEFTLDLESFKIKPVPTFSMSTSYDTAESTKKHSSIASILFGSFDASYTDSSNKRVKFEEEIVQKHQSKWEVQEGSWYNAPRPTLTIHTKTR